MGKRKERRMSPDERAAWRAQRLAELPPGVPVDYFGELCQRLDACGPWGCEDGQHALSAAVVWIRHTDYADREAEVRAWVEALGGVCDCTIRDRVYRRLQQLFEDYEDTDG
jgi:hypothetical protein